MRKLHILGLALFSVFAFSAVAAVSASALSGPKWIVVLCENVGAAKGLFLLRSATGKCEEKDATPEGEWETTLHVLELNETVNILSDGGVFLLLSMLANVECATEQDTGKLFGGNPGTDLTTIEFLTCNLEGHVHCLAENIATGIILVESLTVLVYPHPTTEPPTLAEAEKEAMDAFVPDLPTEEANNLFAEFTLKNAAGFTECGLLAGQKGKPTATGTQIGNPSGDTLFDKRCGVLTWMGKLNGSSIFERTKSGEETVLGALEAPEPPVTEAWLWNNETSKFELIECKLEAFTGVAKEIGTTDVDLESGELFGWEVGP